MSKSRILAIKEKKRERIQIFTDNIKSYYQNSTLLKDINVLRLYKKYLFSLYIIVQNIVVPGANKYPLYNFNTFYISLLVWVLIAPPTGKNWNFFFRHKKSDSLTRSYNANETPLWQFALFLMIFTNVYGFFANLAY